MPLVSVLITAFNSENYIVETIESILNQTFQDFEIIFINDGSTDKTETVIEPFMKKIKYFYQKNQGAYQALNTAFLKANGEYFAIQDHDDISIPNRFEKELYILTNNPKYGMVYSPAIFIDTNGKEFSVWDTGKNHQYVASSFYDLYINGNTIPHSSAMYRRSYIREEYPYDSSLKISGDYFFSLQLAHKYNIYKFDYPLIKVRKKREAQPSADRLKMFVEEKIILKNIYNLYEKESPRVNWQCYRKALSNQYTKEAKYNWGEKNYLQVLKCLVKSGWQRPLNLKLWKFILYLYYYTITKPFRNFLK